jgi:hypothetical protein
MENRLAEVVDKPVIMEQNADEKMCSCGSDVVDEMCSSGDFDTCRSRHMSTKGGFVEIQIGNAVIIKSIYVPKSEYKLTFCI